MRDWFLQLNSATLLADKPYHWLYNNCEAAAVWCKTGRWCTLQALSLLKRTAAGQAKSTAVLAGTAAATQVTVTAPATGIWGWFGMTSTTQLPLLFVGKQVNQLCINSRLQGAEAFLLLFRKVQHSMEKGRQDLAWSGRSEFRTSTPAASATRASSATRATSWCVPARLLLVVRNRRSDDYPVAKDDRS